ncbi:hypothetical protein [Streptomyces sp. NPDC049040]|uniref:hypothetical protein n=1 Tax=Streptomyces sp. NPDC049040 TaxID=3365593 RepID=UPI0037165653
MSFEELVRDALHEQAESTRPAPADLAGRVLARRARRRTRGFTVATVAAVAAVAFAASVITVGAGRGHDPHTGDGAPAASGVEAHPSQSPPLDRIAAGDQVLAAYYSTRNVAQPNHDVVLTRTYQLLNPSTGRYVKDPRWSDVAVAPGLRTAAVLEQALPADRVGILDLATGKVTRWIPVPQGAGAVEFSPDGGRLVATTYAKDPNRLFWADRAAVQGSSQPQSEYSRTGFSVIDVASGAARWHALAPDRSLPPGPDLGSGFSLSFNADGTLLTERMMASPETVFHRLDGTTAPAPAKEKYADTALAPAGLSPDGTLMAGGFAGEGAKTATEVLDPATGRRVALQGGQRLLAWVDRRHLIAWDIPPGGNEFGNRLVLVTVGSDKEVPLSGARPGTEGSPARWEPVFAHR